MVKFNYKIIRVIIGLTFLVNFIRIINAEESVEAKAGDGGDRKGLLLYLPFDGFLEAQYARGDENATVEGELKFEKGMKGQAVLIGEDIILNYARADNFNAEKGTVMMWVRPNWASSSMGSSDNRTLFFIDRVTKIYYSGYTKGYNAMCRKENGDDFVIGSTENTLFEKGTWHHFAFTWDNSKGLKVYLNGILANEVSISWKPCPSPGAYISIGSGGGLGNIDAIIDELYIYERVLADSEIRSHYRAIKKGAEE